VPRSAPDVYEAVAEPLRRRILELLAGAERAVNDVVAALGRDQPSVSKQLRVLRQAKAVRVRRSGRRRLYSLAASALRPLHGWVAQFERHWRLQLDEIQTRAERRARQRKNQGDPP